MSEENTDQSVEIKVPKKKWVKFEDDIKINDENSSESAAHKSDAISINVPSTPKGGTSFSGAILPTESVHINVNHIRSTDTSNANTSQGINLRTIDLHETSNGVSSVQPTSVIRQGFGSYFIFLYFDEHCIYLQL